jgi:hypothetical protein
MRSQLDLSVAKLFGSYESPFWLRSRAVTSHGCGGQKKQICFCWEGHERNKRRVTASRIRRSGIDRVVTIHEAGHAVGVILTAPMLGWRDDEVLNWIEIHATPVALGVPQAITSGPLLSKPMEDYCRVQGVGRSVDPTLFADLRAAGLDLTDWFKARCISSIFGSVAEARATGRTFGAVMASDAADDDLNDIMRDGNWCCLTADEIQSAIRENAVFAGHYN